MQITILMLEITEAAAATQVVDVTLIVDAIRQQIQ